MDVGQYFLREPVNQGKIELVHVSTLEQVELGGTLEAPQGASQSGRKEPCARRAVTEVAT